MRVISTCLAIFIMVLCFFAIFLNMLIHPHIYEYALKVSIYLSVFMVGLCYLYMAKRNSAINFLLKKSKFEDRVTLILGVPIVIPIFLIFSISIGLPAALHFYSNVESTAVVTVSYKSHKRFSYCVSIEEFNTLLGPEICFKEKAEWDSVTIGDILVLDGTKSLWGFNFNEIKEVNKRLW